MAWGQGGRSRGQPHTGTNTHFKQTKQTGNGAAHGGLLVRLKRTCNSTPLPLTLHLDLFITLCT